ncbi:hypothetical protein [Pseudomonas sp. GM25]|uniref:hypothetical protein n=1 Tax=Pseudomonas sp. GM25 TaxID=1144327 RepID=UPI0012FBBDD3|nr:hypothetical protein [Pseudomonas sp. GM25]
MSTSWAGSETHVKKVLGALVTKSVGQNPFSYRICGRYSPANTLAGSKKQQSSSLTDDQDAQRFLEDF